MEHWAIKHPTKLHAEPLDSFNGLNEWALVAEDDQGNRLTIVTTGDRFRDALWGKGLQQMTHAEQVREMYVRGEVEIESFERALERAR